METASMLPTRRNFVRQVGSFLSDDVDDFDEVEDPRLVPAPRERGADADVEGAIFESSLDSGMLQQRRTAGATRERLETQGVVRKRKRLGQPEPLDHHFFF
ncbi:hypothetical protein MRX96_034750 [Rhipicephalus microplus]